MSNMSYCRFENTARDFSDCLDALRTMAENQGRERDEEYEENQEQYSDLSEYEKSGLKRMLEMCDEYKELAEQLLEDNK